MKALLSLLAGVVALTATAASAQVVDLSGRYRCVNMCRDGLIGSPAFVTQNGWDLNLVNEAGEPTRAWIDRGGHIWVQNWNEGAIYSPDGLVIQFDRGTVWQRDLGPVEVVPGPQGPEGDPAHGAAAGRERRARTHRLRRQLGRRHQQPDGQLRPAVSIRGPDHQRRRRLSGRPGQSAGRVAPDGSVWVSVAGGGQSAGGEGRLSRNTGGGTWRGQGAAGNCAGTWQAARRG